MAYINFKEEKSVAIKELQKRRNNNENISIKVTSDNSKIDLDKWEKYSFKTISDRTINSSHVEGEDKFLEIREKNIVCSHIIRCKFYNIKFILQRSFFPIVGVRLYQLLYFIRIHNLILLTISIYFSSLCL